MVGLLYLPRLFVYHNESKRNSEMDSTFLKMEYRLYNYIMNPALLVSFSFGLYLLYENKDLLYENYFLIKFLLVLLLVFYHLYLNSLYKDFKKGYRNKKTKFYRIINEIPTILMIIVIFLIIVKPEIHL